jgi:hypothetical protein
MMFPYPNLSYSQLVETSAGNSTITDINLTGTASINNLSVPNLASFYYALGMKVRCVGMGARVFYEGTELNRSARIFGGYVPIVGAALTVATTGTALSPLSVCTGGYSQVTGQIRDNITDCYEAKVQGDKVVEFFWKPSKAPAYQLYSTTDYPTTVTSAGTTVAPPNNWNAPAGGNGNEAGQNALIVIIEGDTTPTAVIGSNVYAIDLVWHWEVVPDDITGVIYDTSVSFSHAPQYDLAVNSAAVLSAGRTITQATERPLGFQGGR